MMVKRRKSLHFQRNSCIVPFSAPVQQGGNSIKISRQSIFSVIDKYLWLHGIGFKHGISFTRKYLISTFASLLLAAIVEGNFLFGVYASYIRIQSGTNIRGVLVDIAIETFQCVMRILFYCSRKKMGNFLLKFEQTFSGVVRDQIPIGQFKWKMIILLFLSDFIPLFWKLNYVHVTTSAAGNLLYDGYIPQSYASAVVWLNSIIYSIVVVERAVIALFSSVCFMLKEWLAKLNAQLRKSNADLEYISKMFLEISAFITSINRLFHSHLLILFLLLLTSAFRNAYYAAFNSFGKVIFRTQDSISAFCFFSEFACLCLFGSFVIDAVSDIKATCQVLAHRHFDQRSLHFISIMKDGIEGFKVLNSIVIDMSLILSAIGVLVTYGILIATFNTADSSA